MTTNWTYSSYYAAASLVGACTLVDPATQKVHWYRTYGSGGASLCLESRKFTARSSRWYEVMYPHKCVVFCARCTELSHTVSERGGR